MHLYHQKEKGKGQEEKAVVYGIKLPVAATGSRFVYCCLHDLFFYSNLLSTQAHTFAPPLSNWIRLHFYDVKYKNVSIRYHYPTTLTEIFYPN